MAELTRELLINKYWQEGKSLAQIAKQFSLPSASSILKVMRNFDIPRRTLLEAAALNPPPNLKRPNLQTSKELAYIIGVHLGDGCVNIRFDKFQYQWRVKGEREFVDNIARVLQLIGLNSWINRENDCFRISTASRIFVQWLTKLSLQNIETLLVSDNLKLSFIEGFYDAEGYLGIVHRQNRTFPHIWVKIGNTNLPLLEMCQRLLTDLGIYSRVYLSNRVKPPRQTYYQLTVPSYYWTQNFLSKVESCIPHKGLIMLNDKLASYPAPRIRPKKRTLREAYGGSNVRTKT